MIASLWRAALLGASMLVLPLQAAQSATQQTTHQATRHAAGSQAKQTKQAAVDPQAVQALRNMSAYLRTLKSFEIKASTTREEIDDHGQKLQFTGALDYKVRRPNGFVIRSDEDRRVRELFYDGKSLTLFTPATGFYAHVPAPPTIRETLTLAADRYDIHPPLVDLFKWGEGDEGAKKLTSGYKVGESVVNGQDVDHYAFRQKGVDWQIWIARGDKPVPVRVVVTGREVKEAPQFSVNMAWTPSAQFADNTFTFQPPSGSKQIGMASSQ